MRPNKYAGPCRKCRTPVPAGEGALVGPPWANECLKCHQPPVSKVSFTLVGGFVEIRITGFLGPGLFQAYKRSVKGKFNGKVTVCRPTEAAKFIPVMVSSEVPVELTADLANELQKFSPDYNFQSLVSSKPSQPSLPEVMVEDPEPDDIRDEDVPF